MILSLLAATASTVGSVTFFRIPVGAKFLNSASLLLGIASIMKLRISGWFERVIEVYGDDAKYPYGPPSHIARQIIDNPDKPIITWLRNVLFFETKTGAHLGLASLAFALIAVWLPAS